MKLIVNLSEEEIRGIIANYLQETFGIVFAAKDIPIQVKSKQNYKSEWEEAEIRVSTTITKDLK